MGETKKIADTITRVAEFQCTRSRYETRFRPSGMEGEYEKEIPETAIDKTVPVTIRVIPNETPEKTKDRFEEAAKIELRGMKFRNEDAECKSLSFARFLPTAGEVLKAKRSKAPSLLLDVLSDVLTASGKAMQDCQKATGSYVMCKPQP